LSTLRNASRALKAHVDVPASQFATHIAECLKQENFILNWRLIQEGSPQGVLRLYLKYTKDRRPILRNVRRVSRPGLRIYASKTAIPKVLAGIGISILSTPKGILADREAKKAKVGGELICSVW